MRVDPMTVTIGAEVGGIDLADDLSDQVVDDLRGALLDYKVLFFRDQHRLDRERHVAFGSRFGDLEIHPITPAGQDHPEIFVLPSGGTYGAPSVWHSDVTWRPEPSMGSILRGIELPPIGGDTLWADMGSAYDLLDDGTKAMVDGMVAFHDYAQTFGFGKSPEEHEKMREEHPTVEHPVVRTHPETKRKTLYVNGAFTRGIKGMEPRASKRLLVKLQRQAWLPTVQCRFRWLPGSVAFWDNRATQHAASNDFLPNRRIMERVTVAGDRPY